MQRSSKGLSNQENVKPLAEGSTNQWRAGVINFRNIFQGIGRRVEGMSFSRLLANSAKHSNKAHRLRVLSLLTMRILKQKKQSAFNRLKSKRIQHIVSQKGSSNLALTVRRLYKNLMKTVMRRLRGFDLLRQSQGRHSSSSNVLSVSQDSLGGSRIIALQVKSSQQSLQGSTQFNNDEATTFNIILSTLRGKKYKDTRREIEYFLKKSKKEAFCAILREVLALIEEMDMVQADSKGKSKLHIDLLANMAQFDKLFRSQKPEDMEKLKNKCKAQSASVETIQLFQSFINIYAENRRLKKKESASTQKQMKSAEKDRQKRSIESENQQLKKAIKGLELQLEQLNSDKEKLEGSLKKAERSRPSLLPRRPSYQKDQTPIKTPKKNESNESQLQAQINRLDREVQQLTAKHQASFLSLSAKYSALQLECDSVLGQKKQLSLQVKEFQQGVRCFKMIQQKQSQKRILDKEVNGFKRVYPDSVFVKLFALFASEDSTLMNIQNILNLFNDNSWKRRTNFQIKEETPVTGQLNKITQILYEVHQQRDELARTVQDLQKRDMAATEASEKLKMEKPRGKNNNVKTNPTNEQLEQLKLQIQQIREDNQRLNEQNTRLKNELKNKDKQLQSSRSKQNQELVRINKELLQETQKENERLAMQLEKITLDNQRLTKEAEQQRLALQMIRGDERNVGESDGRMDQLEGRLVSSQEKLANYKYLFDKTKKERDNLRLQLEEKNEELELVKQNEERYQAVKRASEVKIVELKHSYESNQLEIRKIENQVERLLQERQVIIRERMVIEERLGVVTQLREKEALQLKEQIQVQQGINRQFQHQFEELNHRYQMDAVSWEQERTHILRGLQRAEEEGIRIKGRYQAEHTEWKDKCDRYAKELVQSRKDSAVQREILRQKIADFSRLTDSLPVMATPSEDLQKQELRKQLQLANQQLTVWLRSKEGEKRQHRQQIQELVSASQLENAVHAEEKRILREEIERARNEEYTINQEKIKKLRDDILSLRNENERLIGIIDTNQTNFDHLIAEHREMRSTIAYLQEENHRIGEAAELAEREKLELVQKLETLEEQLIEFQGKISGAMNEEQRTDSQAGIRSLNEEKEFLIMKNAEQARELIQMQHELIRLQAELNNRQNQASKPVNSQYCRYLEEKLKEQQVEQRRLREKEVQLMQRFQAQLQRVRQLQLEKHLQRDNELKISLARADTAREISALKDKLSMCELALKQKEEKINQLSITPQMQHLNKQDMQEQTRIKNLEEEIRFLSAENKRFKALIEESGRIRHYYEEKNEEYHKLGLENKRLIQKMGMIEASAKQIEKKYLQTQSIVMQLESRLQESTFARSWAEQETNGIPSKSMREELEWLKQQLHAREEDIRQLRNRELQASVTLKRNEELIAQLSLKEQRMHRDTCLLEDAKGRIRNSQELLRSEKELRRASEAHLTSEIKELRQQANFLRSQIEQLKSRNFKLQQNLESTSQYEHDFLFEIARQLDQNYQIQGQQQIQLRILQKISLEIGELIDFNTRLKSQCELIEREKQSSIHLVENSFNSSLRFMVNDLLEYLSTNQLINPENLPYLSPNAGGEKLISKLGLLLKDLFAACACDRQNAARSSQLLKEFKRILDEFCENNNLQNFSKLRSALMNID